MRNWLLVLALLPACTQEPKKTPTEHRAPEPIPSGFEVNTFFGNDTSAIKVRTDGGPTALGGEAGAAAEPSGATASADAPTPTEGGDVKVLEAGEEPRAVRRYDLKQGRTDQIAVTLNTVMTQEVAGQPPQTQSQPPMIFSLALSSDGRDAASGTIGMKVTYTKAEAVPGPEVPPAQAKQLAQAFRALAGQAATFTLTPRGTLSGFKLTNERLARSELGPLAQQALDGIFVALPAEPIGKGARWQQVTAGHQEGLSAQVTSSYTLKEVSADALLVTITTTRKAPTQPYPDPRAPRGTVVTVDGTATATIKVRLERAPVKGSSESTTSITVTQPGPGGKAQSSLQKVSMKQTLESAAP